jgi:quercetin dioxygenase-like cupin family protein
MIFASPPRVTLVGFMALALKSKRLGTVPVPFAASVYTLNSAAQRLCVEFTALSRSSSPRQVYTAQMKPTRRDLAFLLPALAAIDSKAQAAAIASKAYPFDEIPVRASGTDGANKTRSILKGVLHSGFALEVHETELPPGGAPHPPHRHLHEEMFVVLEGSVDFMVNDATTRLGPGSAGIAASNDLHGIANSSAARCRYVVFAFGEDK